MVDQFANFQINCACPLLVVVKWHTNDFSQFSTVHPHYHPTNQPTNSEPTTQVSANQDVIVINDSVSKNPVSHYV